MTTLWLLSVPTVREQIDPTKWLWRRYCLDVSLTLIKQNGHWTTIRSASEDQLNAAQNYFVGGYQYQVNATVFNELTADGFGSSLTPLN
jgi:hypothetical protein